MCILPENVVQRHTYLDLQTWLRRTRPELTFLTSYATFASLNQKSGALTQRDLWARMLLAIRGLSAEKVAEIIDIWPTPLEFFQELTRVERQMQKEGDGSHIGKGAAKGMTTGQRMLFERIQPPEQRRKIGAVLSARVWDYFMSRKYSDPDADG